MLDRTRSSQIVMIGVGLLALAAAIFSSVYWAEYFLHGNATIVANKLLNMTEHAGFLALPFLPFIFNDLTYPPRLIISESGVTLRLRGDAQTISWYELTEINLQTRLDRGEMGRSKKTICRAIGRNRRLVWDAPTFGIDPMRLAFYLQKRGQKAAGNKIKITRGSSTSPFWIFRLSLIGFVVALAIFMAFIAKGMKQNNPVAIWLIHHMPH